MDHERVSRRRLPRAAAVTSAVASLAYLTWRLLFTVHWAAWWLAVPFLLLEVHASLRFALTVFELWGAEEEGLPVHTTLPDLTVAVVIPTYDEGIDVLLPTVAAALALEPAHQTWVLDDGARPDVAELAHQLGAGYIARPDNQYAKAGNLNFALGYIETDLLAVLDADHVAQPEFLRKTLPYFVDPGLGLVQTPQDFYNINSFVHLDKDFHEEQFFHHAIQSGKNRYKSALWCGTGSVVRADALRSIGGVATASITEDLHTTIRLHEAGWRTTHHNEVLSRGLAPRTFDEFRLQRWRWGAGAMQAFAIDPPLRAPGLSLGQRVSPRFPPHPTDRGAHWNCAGDGRFGPPRSCRRGGHDRPATGHQGPGRRAAPVVVGDCVRSPTHADEFELDARVLASSRVGIRGNS